MIGLSVASAAMLLAVAPAAATTDSAPPIGGYSGAGKPVPPGDDEIPYEVRFLTGSTEIGDVQVKRVVGARRSGRLLVQVPVRYPELRDRATLLLSDDATYRGRVAVRLRGGPAGRGMKLSDDTALPLGAGAETARFVHNIVVSRSAGRRMLAGTSMGEPLGDTDRPRLVARMHAVARFDQFGTGRAEEDSADRESRAIRVSETRPGASHGTNWQCAGDADLHGRPGPAETLTHRTYSGTVFPHIGQSQSIRLCLASDLRLDLDDWYWLGRAPAAEDPARHCQCAEDRERVRHRHLDAGSRRQRRPE